MTERPERPPGISSLSSGDDDSIPTAIDAPRIARAPQGEDHLTLMDAKAQKGFLDLSQQLGAIDDSDFDARYRMGEVLGRGGMGEVRFSTDLRIGRTVARIAINGFGMKVIYNDVQDVSKFVEVGAESVSFDELLKQSDILTLHVDMRAGNEKFINAVSIKKMKP